MVEVRPDCVGPGEFVGVVVLAGGVGLLGVELLLVLLGVDHVAGLGGHGVGA